MNAAVQIFFYSGQIENDSLTGQFNQEI